MKIEERRQLASSLRNADEPMLREIVREAESFLTAQLQAGLAADQRALTLAGILGAVLAGLLGGTVTVIAAKIDLWPHIFTIAVCFAILLRALFAAVNAARPTNFCYAGNSPSKWSSDAESAKPLKEALAGQAALYAQGISENIEILEE